MAKNSLHLATGRSGSERMFDVRVLRSASDRSRFWWLLRDQRGRIVEASSNTYDSESQARSAADVAANRTSFAGQVQGQLPITP